MKHWGLAFIMLWSPLQSWAQTTRATDYFNNGAATFIREDAEKALAIVNEGLQFHPDDEQLLKLKALLEQQQQQQQNQQQKNEQNEEKQQEQSEKPDESDPPEEQQQDQENPEEQPPPEEQEQPQEKEQPQAGDMTEEEAEMVLDSFRQLEEAQRDQMMQEMIRRKMSEMPPVEKDW